jgi:hypothetical protein
MCFVGFTFEAASRQRAHHGFLLALDNAKEGARRALGPAVILLRNR